MVSGVLVGPAELGLLMFLVGKLNAPLAGDRPSDASRCRHGCRIAFTERLHRVKLAVARRRPQNGNGTDDAGELPADLGTTDYPPLGRTVNRGDGHVYGPYRCDDH